jgi:Na+-translocating ferredoxin:NAD+ oxidoreductase RnfD subunit
MGAFALSGKCFVAIWNVGPVCGRDYWVDICTSPELLIFVFFMMSDPKTAPRTMLGRAAYGALTACLAAAMISIQPTEFGIKVALMSSLTIVCALVPLMERLIARRLLMLAGIRTRALTPALVAALLITVAVPIGVVQLAGNQRVFDIERGRAAPGTPTQ